MRPCGAAPPSIIPAPHSCTFKHIYLAIYRRVFGGRGERRSKAFISCRNALARRQPEAFPKEWFRVFIKLQEFQELQKNGEAAVTSQPLTNLVVEVLFILNIP
ncbi:hypothetical protein CDAR_591491 [Caerostris darwini]|uniref:Uncharacterized protein n=1 Tax=Caerostris darwini TaxID=1538125 RepID=A0AAV4PJY9_9ARAC|nr:hypothetical protein CDAR_591491 [Caerostris darwini]